MYYCRGTQLHTEGRRRIVATSAKHHYYHLNIYTISSLIMNLGPSEKMGYLETFYPNKKSLSMGTINEASSVCLRPVLILIKIVSLIRGMVPALSSHNGYNDIPHYNSAI